MNENRTILITSRDQGQFRLTRSLFEAEGYRVIFEPDVTKSVVIARAACPKLIISELAEVDIDGPRFCRRVRKDGLLRHIPIVFVGDLSRESWIVRESIRGGASEYLQKPFDQTGLFELCREVQSATSADIRERRENALRSDATVRQFDRWAVVNELICVN